MGVVLVLDAGDYIIQAVELRIEVLHLLFNNADRGIVDRCCDISQGFGMFVGSLVRVSEAPKEVVKRWNLQQSRT